MDDNGSDKDGSFVKFLSVIGRGDIPRDREHSKRSLSSSSSSDHRQSSSGTISRGEFDSLLGRIQSLEQSRDDGGVDVENNCNRPLPLHARIEESHEHDESPTCPSPQVTDVRVPGGGIDDGVPASSLAISSQRTETTTHSSTLALEENNNKLDVKDHKQRRNSSLIDIRNVKSAWKFEEYVLPPSTYTLLITEPVVSQPFFVAIVATSIAIMCLAITLKDELANGTPGNKLGLPAGVRTEVRMAQYLGIIIGVLMEQEVPLGLEIISKCVEQEIMGRRPFRRSKVMCSSILRLVVGYLFLACLFLTVIQENNVLNIFFDVLALEFVENVDDVMYALSKRGFFGKSLRRATHLTHVYESNGPTTLKYTKWMNRFIRIVYYMNGLIMLFGLSYLTSKQSVGKYRCGSLHIAFGDDVWEEAWVKLDGGLGYEKRLLVYSHFNGIYKENGSHHGRPRYVEMNKEDGVPFQSTKGAEVVYCDSLGAWVFKHGQIFTSKDEVEENECSWLLKSPPTDSFDVIKVAQESSWTVWTGQIEPDYSISVTCNECNYDSDCNYHGQCIDQMCECGDEHFGIHCEIQRPCGIIRSERDSSTTLQLLQSTDNTFVKVYGHPVYIQPMAGIPHGLLRLGAHSGHNTFLHNTDEAFSSSDMDSQHVGHTLGNVTHKMHNSTVEHESDLAMSHSKHEDDNDISSAMANNETIEQMHSSHNDHSLSDPMHMAEEEPNPSQMHTQHVGDTMSNTPDAMSTMTMENEPDTPTMDSGHEHTGDMSSKITRNATAGEVHSSQEHGMTGHVFSDQMPSDGISSNETAYDPDPSQHDVWQFSADLFEDDDFFEIHYEMEAFQRLMMNYTFVLRYTGRRWYGQINPPGVDLAAIGKEEYHAFWNNAFSGLGVDDNATVIISAPTIDASPVGIDFFEMRRRNKIFETSRYGYDYGPFGVLIPLAGYEGAGFFHCNKGSDEL